MKTNKNVLGIVSSLRSCLKESELINVVKSSSSFDGISEFIYKRGGEQRISNSEALLMASLYGAKEAGAKINMLNLRNYFSLIDDEPISASGVLESIEECRGLVLSSPVYFGDRSSLIADFIKFLKNSNIDARLLLDGKGVGIVSVGAKRNGGQETTNIFALVDALDLGACVVGNGPPESQYGGTGWGGALGGIIDDHFGLKTAKGTGHRVGLLNNILNISSEPSKIKILVIITKNDKNSEFSELLSELPFSSNVELDVLDVSKMRIKRCLACKICPSGNLDQKYTCVIPASSGSKRDDMELVHEHMEKADGLILSQYHGKNAGPDKFQVFMERNRFIRRNDYELTDRAFSFITVTDSLTDISFVRAMTSFLRHNMIIVGPFYKRFQDEKKTVQIENISLESFARRFEEITRKTALARKLQLSSIDAKYEAVGYAESSLK
jgi:multimeric flavodoxin WrbA